MDKKTSIFLAVFIVLIILALAILVGYKIVKNPISDAGVKFSGIISEVNDGCTYDATCYIVVGGKKVIIEGGSIKPLKLGKVIGTPQVGKEAEIFVRQVSQAENLYTLEGNENYYIKVKENPTTDCDSQFNNLEKMIAEFNYCNNDSDCIKKDLGIMDFCDGYLINKNANLDEFNSKLRKYESDGCPQPIDNCLKSESGLKCINKKCVFEDTQNIESCLSTGGKILTSLCCISARNSPNSCEIGACGCSPNNSRQVKVCDCGEGRCFNGTKCIDLANSH